MGVLLMALIIGTVAGGPSLPSIYQRQLVADIYQAVARAKLDVDIAHSIVREFKQIRKGRVEPNAIRNSKNTA